jgi:hypothetical protein
MAMEIILALSLGLLIIDLSRLVRDALLWLGRQLSERPSPAPGKRR